MHGMERVNLCFEELQELFSQLYLYCFAVPRHKRNTKIFYLASSIPCNGNNKNSFLTLF